ncbi:unnamed protein product [Lampetra fluviatilis]
MGGSSSSSSRAAPLFSVGSISSLGVREGRRRRSRLEAAGLVAGLGTPRAPDGVCAEPPRPRGGGQGEGALPVPAVSAGACRALGSREASGVRCFTAANKAPGRAPIGRGRLRARQLQQLALRGRESGDRDDGHGGRARVAWNSQRPPARAKGGTNAASVRPLPPPGSPTSLVAVSPPHSV